MAEKIESSIKRDFRIAFIQEEMITQQGIMALSAVLKENGFLTEVFVIQGEKDSIVDSILNYIPDIVACSVMTPGFGIAMEIVNKLKAINQKLFVIIGGPHPTFYNDIIYKEDNIDAICLGEGEHALLELCLSLQKGAVNTKIKNLWIKQNGNIVKNNLGDLVVDLDSLPIPDYDLYFRKYPVLAEREIKFIMGRGCPFNCSYCFNKDMKKLYGGDWVRFKSNKKMIKDIKEISSEYPARWISFHDDTFNVGKKRLKAFLELYKKEIGKPFLCRIRIDLTDEEQIELLKQAGVDKIVVGIEHGDEVFRKKMLNRDMSNKQIVKFGKWVRSRNIRLQTNNIIGFPEETIDLAFSTVEINQKIKPELASAFLLNPYPGTDIYKYALETGNLIDDFNIDKLTGHYCWSESVREIKSSIKNKNINQLINLRCFFMLLVQYPWLKPIVKILILFPNNRIYEFIWQITGVFKVSWKYSPREERRKLLSRMLKTLIRRP